MAEFDPGLEQGEVVSADELQRIFRCSGQGGMRRSHRTNSLVLITRGPGGTYFDRWEGKVLHYTGMGLIGDQTLDRTQNKTLAEADTNGVAVFHFDNPAPNQYIFTGRVNLSGSPYPETQPDKDGNRRRVWVFPLTR